MSYPNGKRERVKLQWFEAKHSLASNASLLKCETVFEGSPKHCAEEMMRWLHRKNFIAPIDMMFLAGRLDFTLYARLRKMEDEALAKDVVSKENPTPSEQQPF